MRIEMDEQVWNVSDDLSVLEVLAEISDRAHAQQRVVTALTLGGRPISDRDLVPALLSQRAETVGRVCARTESMTQVIDGAQETLKRYGAVLTSEAKPFVRDLRDGRPAEVIDAWLGRLADYLELHGRASEVGKETGEGLSDWCRRLLEARGAGDAVLVADLLEYEILPRLAP